MNEAQNPVVNHGTEEGSDYTITLYSYSRCMNFLLFVNDHFCYFVVYTHYLKEGVKSHEQCHNFTFIVRFIHITWQETAQMTFITLPTFLLLYSGRFFNVTSHPPSMSAL